MKKLALAAVLLSLSMGVANADIVEYKRLKQEALTAYQNQDYQKTFQIVESLAKQGNAEAQNSLGLLYKAGLGVAQNSATAVQWFEKAAQQGDAEAQYNLGALYENGQSVAKNYAAAKLWYEKAAQQGLAQAQYNLGVMYTNGDGVAQNYALAKQWYEKAAQQGYEDAKTALQFLQDKN